MHKFTFFFLILTNFYHVNSQCISNANAATVENICEQIENTDQNINKIRQQPISKQFKHIYNIEDLNNDYMIYRSFPFIFHLYLKNEVTKGINTLPANSGVGYITGDSHIRNFEYVINKKSLDEDKDNPKATLIMNDFDESGLGLYLQDLVRLYGSLKLSEEFRKFRDDQFLNKYLSAYKDGCLKKNKDKYKIRLINKSKLDKRGKLKKDDIEKEDIHNKNTLLALINKNLKTNFKSHKEIEKICKFKPVKKDKKDIIWKTTAKDCPKVKDNGGSYNLPVCTLRGNRHKCKLKLVPFYSSTNHEFAHLVFPNYQETQGKELEASKFNVFKDFNKKSTQRKKIIILEHNNQRIRLSVTISSNYKDPGIEYLSNEHKEADILLAFYTLGKTHRILNNDHQHYSLSLARFCQGLKSYKGSQTENLTNDVVDLFKEKLPLCFAQ